VAVGHDGERGKAARPRKRAGVQAQNGAKASKNGAVRRTMPDAAIAATMADAILPLEEIPAFLYGLCA